MSEKSDATATADDDVKLSMDTKCKCIQNIIIVQLMRLKWADEF